MSFFNELKRRNVFRVGAAYLVVGWLVLQIVDVVGDMLALPDTVGRTILMLLAIGFPIALIVSWIYEVTPEGITTQEAVDAGMKTSYEKKLNAVIIGGLALALVLVVLDAYVLEDRDESPRVETAVEDSQPFQGEIIATANMEKTLAVLPFANLSSDPEQEYFSDGLAEELLNQLAQVQDLRVAARTSSFYYKGRNEDMRTIGRQLGVNFILEGSVRKAGDTVRITTQLIQADDGFHLWSDTYDRSLDNIFAIQDEIATEVTRALSISLGAGEFEVPGGTRNVVAWDEFLQGRYAFNEGSPDSLLSAIEHWNRAVALDPDFGGAWIWLVAMYRNMGDFLDPDLSADFPRLGNEAFANATGLAPDMPRVIDQNLQALMREGRWQEAEAAFLEHLDRIGSSNEVLNRGYGSFLANVGRIKDAIPYYLRAYRLNPLDPLTLFNLTMMLGVDGRFDEAEAYMQEGVANGQGLESAILLADWTNVIYQGDLVRLREKIDTYYADPENHDRFVVSEEFMRTILELLESNDRDHAVNEARRLLADGTMSGIGMAIMRWVALQHQDMPLYQMLSDNFGNLGGYRWSRLPGAFRQTEAFKDAMREQGLVDYCRSTGNWGEFCRPLGNDDFEYF